MNERIYLYIGLCLMATMIACGGKTNALEEKEHNPTSTSTSPITEKSTMPTFHTSFQERFHSRQIVLVTTPSESNITGTLCILQYEEAKKTWTKTTEGISVTLGRTGLAWGRGMHPNDWNQAPLKKEGDGKAPQGVFKIIRFFGNIPKEYLPFKSGIPYLHVDSDSWVCVDDTDSEFYNRIVSEKKVVKDWKSAEKMLRKDGLYSLGAVLDYNLNPVIKGGGSCVFMHIWRAEDKPTAGCTATAKEKLTKLFSLLDAELSPVLVQMTESNAKKYLTIYGIEI